MIFSTFFCLPFSHAPPLLIILVHNGARVLAETPGLLPWRKLMPTSRSSPSMTAHPTTARKFSMPMLRATFACACSNRSTWNSAWRATSGRRLRLGMALVFGQRRFAAAGRGGDDAGSGAGKIPPSMAMCWEEGFWIANCDAVRARIEAQTPGETRKGSCRAIGFAQGFSFNTSRS